MILKILKIAARDSWVFSASTGEVDVQLSLKPPICQDVYCSKPCTRQRNTHQSDLSSINIGCINVWQWMTRATVKARMFQVLLCITNNSIKPQSFDYTVKWSNSSFSSGSIWHKAFICAQLNVIQFFLTERKDPIKCYHIVSKWAQEQ